MATATKTLFKVGSLVHVDSRTWPGINEEGGVGRVVAIDSEHSTVDVRYIVRKRTEKKIDFSFVQPHVFLDDDPPPTHDGNSRRVSRRAQRVEENTKLEEEKKKKEMEERKHRSLTLKEKCAAIIHPVTPGPARSNKNKNKGQRNVEYDLNQMISAIEFKKDDEDGNKKVPVVTPSHSAKKKKKPSKPKQSSPAVSNTKIILASSKAPLSPKKKQHVQINTDNISPDNRVTDLETAKPKTAIQLHDDVESSSIKATTPPQKAPDEKIDVISTLHLPKPEAPKLNSMHPNESSIHKTKKQKVTERPKYISGFSKPIHTKVHTTISKSKEDADKKPTKSDAPIIHNGLEMMYRDNSQKAATFVNDVVGISKENETKKVKVDNKGDCETKQEDNQSEGEGTLTVGADDDRSMQFDTLFSEVMTKQMVDEMSISNLLSAVNNILEKKSERLFSNLELRSQLSRLEALNRIMVVWEDGVVYQI